jgi:hypothetical protein
MRTAVNASKAVPMSDEDVTLSANYLADRILHFDAALASEWTVDRYLAWLGTDACTMQDAKRVRDFTIQACENHVAGEAYPQISRLAALCAQMPRQDVDAENEAQADFIAKWFVKRQERKARRRAEWKRFVADLNWKSWAPLWGALLVVCAVIAVSSLVQ